jgi:hypothetical protein
MILKIKNKRAKQVLSFEDSSGCITIQPGSFIERDVAAFKFESSFVSSLIESMKKQNISVFLDDIEQDVTQVGNYIYGIRESSETKTFYVSTTGSDILGDGSEIKPFANLSKAIEVLQSNGLFLDDNYKINIANGEYADANLTQIKFSFGAKGQLLIEGYEGTIETDDIEYTCTTLESDVKSGITAYYKLTVAGAGWTPHEHFGKVIRIVKNDAGWLEGFEYTIEDNTVDTIILGGASSALATGDSFKIKSIGVTISTPDGFVISNDTRKSWATLGFANIHFINTRSNPRDYFASGDSIYIMGGGPTLLASCIFSDPSGGIAFIHQDGDLNVLWPEIFDFIDYGYNTAYSSGFLLAKTLTYPTVYQDNLAYFMGGSDATIYHLVASNHVTANNPRVSFLYGAFTTIKWDHGAYGFLYGCYFDNHFAGKTTIIIDDNCRLSLLNIYVDQSSSDLIKTVANTRLILDKVTAVNTTGYNLRLGVLSNIVLRTDNSFSGATNDIIWNKSGSAEAFPVSSTTDSEGGWVVQE